MNVTAQHIHMCLWPRIIRPFTNLISRGTQQQHPKLEKEQKTTPKTPPLRVEATPKTPSPRVEVTAGINNVSLAVLNKPSNVTSFGICAEVRIKHYYVILTIIN